jgi:hypothetical protein
MKNERNQGGAKTSDLFNKNTNISQKKKDQSSNKKKSSNSKYIS